MRPFGGHIVKGLKRDFVFISSESLQISEKSKRANYSTRKRLYTKVYFKGLWQRKIRFKRNLTDLCLNLDNEISFENQNQSEVFNQENNIVKMCVGISVRIWPRAAGRILKVDSKVLNSQILH